MNPQTLKTWFGATVIIGAFAMTGATAWPPMAVPSTSVSSATIGTDVSAPLVAPTTSTSPATTAAKLLVPLAVPTTSASPGIIGFDASRLLASAVGCAVDPNSQQLECADTYSLDHGNGDVTICTWRGKGVDNQDEFVRTATVDGKITVECDYGPLCGWQPAAISGPS